MASRASLAEGVAGLGITCLDALSLLVAGTDVTEYIHVREGMMTRASLSVRDLPLRFQYFHTRTLTSTNTFLH